MAVIIKMDSKEFLDDFVKEFNYKKYNFLLVSQDIKTKKTYDNVYAIPSLIPPPNVIAKLINSGKASDYEKKYVQYLSAPKQDALITVLVKLAVVENSNVVLLCSKDEDKYCYLDILANYIESIYGAKVYSYKKYKKNPKKCDSAGDRKKKIVKVLRKKMKNIDTSAEPTVDKSELKDRLGQLKTKELISFAKDKGLKLKKDMSKKEMIKKIINTLF